MDTYLLFRKKAPLAEDGLPWLRGAETHTFTAKRNTTGSASVSAILVRALLACLDGAVEYAEIAGTDHLVARVRSSSSPVACTHCALRSGVLTPPITYCIPHGDQRKITYHVGILALLGALHHPERAADLLEAYQALQTNYQTYGRSEAIRESLCRACDELYYWTKYAGLDPRPENDLLGAAQVASNAGVSPGYGASSIDTSPLTDPAALQRLRTQTLSASPLPPVAPTIQVETTTEVWALSAGSLPPSKRRFPPGSTFYSPAQRVLGKQFAFSRWLPGRPLPLSR